MELQDYFGLTVFWHPIITTIFFTFTTKIIKWV
jgi:hypothetical protein